MVCMLVCRKCWPGSDGGYGMHQDAKLRRCMPAAGVLEELAAREKGVGEGGDAEAGAPPFNHLHTRKKSKRERLL